MLRAVQDEVDEIFDKADHPNIVHPDDFNYDALTKIRKLPLIEKETIDIIKGVLEGIIYVSSHLLIYKPCQIFKEHVIYKDGRWGIRNLICYRDPKETADFDSNRYWPIEYDYHPDENSELVWFIGRLWFELLTDSSLPPIASLTQEQIQKLIDSSGIKDLTIIPLLKMALEVDPNKRMSLEQILGHSFFQFDQGSMINMQSILPSNIYQQSKFSDERFRSAGKYTMIAPGYNPFKEQLFKRDFKEAIVVADLFDKVRTLISDIFEVQEKQHNLDFSCYLIDLMSYLKLKGFQAERQKNMYDLVILSDKIVYTKFMERIIFLQKKLNKRRKSKKFAGLKQKMERCLCMLDQIDADFVEQEFKSYLSTYAYFLHEKCIKKKQQASRSYLKNYKIMILIMLVRCSKYIFSNCRSYLFQDFIDPSGFNLRDVLSNIDKCQDVNKIQKIDQKIIKLYYTK